MKLSQIQNILKATIVGQDVSFDGVCIDTRKLTQGCLFVALKGERVDGHDFIPQAMAEGAAAFLVANREALPEGASGLVVENPLEALACLARFHRTHFNLPVVGITGSCGKTTVKGLVGHILSLMGETLVTSGNFNNHIGMPLTLLKLNNAHRYAVLEMGASAPGDIAFLSTIAKPNIVLINNVYRAHMEGFGTLEGVAVAKGEIYEGLSEDGVAVLNIDSSFAPIWIEKIGQRKAITFGSNPKAMIRAENICLSATDSQFTLITPKGSCEIRMDLLGEHNVMNAIAAVACVYTLNIPMDVIQQAFMTFEGVAGRLRSRQLSNGIRLIDDTYNAIPDAVDAAIKVLAQCDGERILVLGDMKELGDRAKQYHQEVGLTAKTLGIDQLWAVGPMGQWTVESFGQRGKWYSDKDSLLSDLKLLNTPKTILVKGSRSTGMEVVVQGLLQKDGL